MTSKNLFFRLMKEDLKNRIWAVALIALGCFFAYPVSAAFTAGSIREYADYQVGLLNYSKEMYRWLAFDNGMTVFLMMMLALICGLSGFSYLNSKSKVDFYHSIPVKREKLYLVNYIDGILILTVPYAISLVMAVLVSISNGVDGATLWPIALSGFVLHVTYFVLMYTTVVIAAMLTGHLVVGVLGSVVLAFYAPVATTLVQTFFQTFFDTYEWTTSEQLMERFLRISPVMEYVYQVARYNEETFTWLAAVLALVVSVVLAALGLLLYRKRPSEAAGRAMAFGISRPVIRILLTIVSGLGLGVFFWSMRETTGWAIFGVLCGTVICHCVVEIIYHFDFKRLFSHAGQMAACILISVAVLFVFRYDMLGYDRYMPKASQVKDAAVAVNAFNSWASYGQAKQREDGSYWWDYRDREHYGIDGTMNYEDVENLLNLAAAGIAHLEEQEAQKPLRESSAHYNEVNVTETVVNICYRLNSGRRVYRRYTIPIAAVETQLDKIFQDDAYQKGTFRLMNRTPEQVAAVRYREDQKDTILNSLSQEEVTALLETYRKEFQSMTIDQMRREYPVGLIRFTTEIDEAAMAWGERTNSQRSRRDSRYSYSGIFHEKDYYPVYPSFTETLKLLGEQDVYPGTYAKGRDIQSITFRWYHEAETDEFGNKYRQAQDLLITDSDEIRELEPLLIQGQMRYYNQLFRIESLDVEYTVRRDNTNYGYSATIPEGSLPEFVKERIENVKE